MWFFHSGPNFSPSGSSRPGRPRAEAEESSAGVAAKEGKEGGGDEWGERRRMGPEGGAKGGGLQTQRSDVQGEGATKGRRDDKKVVRAVCMAPLHPRAKRQNLLATGVTGTGIFPFRDYGRGRNHRPEAEAVSAWS